MSKSPSVDEQKFAGSVSQSFQELLLQNSSGTLSASGQKSIKKALIQIDSNGLGKILWRLVTDGIVIDASRPSIVDPSFLVSYDYCAISLLGKKTIHGGIHNHHVFILVEGMDIYGRDDISRYELFQNHMDSIDSKGFSKAFIRHRMIKPPIPLTRIESAYYKYELKLNDENLYGFTWIVPRTKALELHQAIQADMNRSIPYKFLGKESFLSFLGGSTSGHNCFSWAREKLLQLDIPKIATDIQSILSTLSTNRMTPVSIAEPDLEFKNIHIHASITHSNLTSLIRGDEYVYYGRGILHAEKGKHDKAIDNFTKVITIKPDFVEAYVTRAASKIVQGDQTGAIEDFTVAITIKRDSLVATGLSTSNEKENLLERLSILTAYRESIVRQMQDGRQYSKLEKDLENISKQISEIENTLKGYKEIKSDSLIKPGRKQWTVLVAAYFGRGFTKALQGNYPEAIVDYTEAIRLKPNFTEAHYYRGLSKHARGDEVGARIDYTEAIRLKPGFTDAYLSRGVSKHAQGEYDSAITDYTHVISLKPGFAIAYYKRADSYAALGKHQKAQDDRLRATLIERRDDPQTELYHAIARGQKEAALSCLNTIHQRHPNAAPTSLTPTAKEEPALLTLARFGHATWLTEFLKHLRIELTNSEGDTALHIAAQYGHIQFCEVLIDEKLLKGRIGGGYHWPLNLIGESPLHAAAVGGQVSLLIRFKEIYHAEQDLQTSTIDGSTVVHLMVRHGHVDALNTLLTRCPFLSVRTKNLAGLDSLMLAVILKKVDMVQLLLKYHVDLANRDREGRTALHLAVQSGEKPLVELLVKQGSFLDVRDRAGKQPEDYTSPDSLIGVYLKKRERDSKHGREHFVQTPREWRNLVFEGGSIRGLAYPNALRTLVEKGVCSLDRIQRVGGTSAGAITALLVGLGYSLDEIEHLTGVKELPECKLPQIKFTELLDGSFGEKLISAKNGDWEVLLGKQHVETWSKIRQIDGVLVGLARILDGTVIIQGASAALAAKAELTKMYQQLNKELGLCPGKKLYDLFDQLIREKLAEKAGYAITTPVTFAELAKCSAFKDMYFVGVNNQRGEVEYFSNEHTPNMLVANAVRISMSIPGVFQPVPKITKDKEGLLHESSDLYVDGGVSLNYPIKLFDFARYGDDSHLSGDHPQINEGTLGLRLVTPKLKVRYERTVPSQGELTPEEVSVSTLWNHIKGTLNSIYEKQESDHSLSGDDFRTIYINTLDIGILDFERAEEVATKTLLGIQGQEGVKDFLKRMQQETAYQVKLPDILEQAVLKYSKIKSYQLEQGQAKLMTVLNLNCPGLVVDFYTYEDIRLHHYLHHGLKIGLWVRDLAGMTAFHVASTTGNMAVLRRLLQAAPDGASAKNHAGQLPHELAETQKYPEIVALLKATQKSVPSPPETAVVGSESLESQRASTLDAKQEFKPISSLPPSYQAVDVPNDHNCLFWSAALGLLLPLRKKPKKFRAMYERLFGTADSISLKQDKNNLEQKISVQAARKNIRAMLITYDFKKNTPSNYERGSLIDLVCRLFRNRVIDQLSEVYKTAEERQAIFLEAGKKNWEEYITNMRLKNAWGGQPEIVAIATLAKNNIEVHGHDQPTTINIPEAVGATLHLLHVNAIHNPEGAKNHYNFGYTSELQLKTKKIDTMILTGNLQSSSASGSTSSSVGSLSSSSSSSSTSSQYTAELSAAMEHESLLAKLSILTAHKDDLPRKIQDGKQNNKLEKKFEGILKKQEEKKSDSLIAVENQYEIALPSTSPLTTSEFKLSAQPLAAFKEKLKTLLTEEYKFSIKRSQSNTLVIQCTSMEYVLGTPKRIKENLSDLIKLLTPAITIKDDQYTMNSDLENGGLTIVAESEALDDIAALLEEAGRPKGIGSYFEPLSQAKAALFGSRKPKVASLGDSNLAPVVAVNCLIQ